MVSNSDSLWSTAQRAARSQVAPAAQNAGSRAVKLRRFRSPHRALCAPLAMPRRRAGPVRLLDDRRPFLQRVLGGDVVSGFPVGAPETAGENAPVMVAVATKVQTQRNIVTEH